MRLMDDSAFELHNPDKSSPLLFICDHASKALPPSYGDLGLDADRLGTHIAYDIGAAALTRQLASSYNATAILGRWSRLLIDLNRGADDPTLVMKLSDGSIIPGNRNVDQAQIAYRIAQYHQPYHAAITSQIDHMLGQGGQAVLISLHSFTPIWKAWPRPWEIGILWDRDSRLAEPLLHHLDQAGFSVGDNEPYHGALENDCMNIHGTKRGLPHCLIEIRQDLIDTEVKTTHLAKRLKPVLDAALADMSR